MRWVVVVWGILMPARLYAQQDTARTRNYTCEDVRQGTGGKGKGTNPYIPFDSTRIQSRASALEFVKEVQRRSHLRALETGAERSVPVLWAIRKVGKYLTCEDELDIVLRDVRFYDKHPDLLPSGVFPWELGWLPCARGFIRSELKKKGLSRMYRGWLIVQASYFWYDEFRDSLLAVARDPSFRPMFRRDAVASIPTWDTSQATLHILISLADTDRATIMMKTIKGEPEPYYPVRHAAAIKLRQMGKESLIPESYLRWKESFDKRRNPIPGYWR